MTSDRWEKIKTYTFWGVIIILVVVPVVAFSPAGPAMYASYIAKYNQEGQPLKPWGAEAYYKLGRYYQVTLNRDAAKKTYDDLIDLYINRNKNKSGLERGNKWVGLALYQKAGILWETGHHQKALQDYEIFVTHFGDSPGMDQEKVNTARTLVTTKRAQ